MPETWIEEAAWPRDSKVVKQMLREYIGTLEEDIRFQDFSGELATLPGKYARPDGAVFVARAAAAHIGIIAFRRFTPDACEMKRLYVRPGFRGLRVGEDLARKAIIEARARGYRTMMLDTLASMHAAKGLYRRLGFKTVPAYYENPLPGTTYMALTL